jgi:hypothetical protein
VIDAQLIDISQATALNNAGEAVGDSYDPGDLSGAIFSGGKVASIVATPNAINGLGQIAGFYKPNSGSVTNLNSASCFLAAARLLGSITPAK